MSEDKSSEILHDLLNYAIPINPQGPGFVTRDEFMATVCVIESKIENASLKQKQWVLTGCIAIIISFGSGYVSLVSKLDRLTEALPDIMLRQTNRGPWMQRQIQIDGRQDGVLTRLDKNYRPLPYEAPPQ